MRRVFAFVMVLAAIAVPGTATAAPILFASTGSTTSQLYSIDVATQTVTLIGGTGVSRMSGLDFNSSGVLYAVAGGSAGPASLYTVNTSTGLATLVGAIDGVQGADGLAFDSADNLYSGGWDGGVGHLLTLNPANGAILTDITMSGSGNSFVAGLDFGPGGQLWGSRGNAGGSTEDLVRINTATGVHTAVGGDFSVVSGIWFAGDGTLYGIRTNGEVITINPGTGAQTLLFATQLANLSGLTGQDQTVIPEPATMMLIGSGLAGLAARRRRQRR